MQAANITLTAATVTQLYHNPSETSEAEVILNSAASIYLGGANVSATNYGTQTPVANDYRVRVAPRDTLYGFSTAGTTCRVLGSP